MSVPYRQLLRMAGQRVNAITGNTHALKEAAYLTSPLTTTQLGNVDMNFSYICDLAAAIVGEIIEAYASVANHPFRIFNASQTSALAHNSNIPSTNSASKPIVGVYGAIRDGSSSLPCTKQPGHLIQTIVDNTDTFIKGSYYYYDIVGRVILHTRTNVTIDVCTFSASDELTAIGANGNVPLPDALLAMAADGMASRMVIDDDFVNQANFYGNYYNAGIQMIRQGGSVYTPAPVAQATVDPRVS